MLGSVMRRIYCEWPKYETKHDHMHFYRPRSREIMYLVASVRQCALSVQGICLCVE